MENPNTIAATMYDVFVVLLLASRQYLATGQIFWDMCLVNISPVDLKLLLKAVRKSKNIFFWVHSVD